MNERVVGLASRFPRIHLAWLGPARPTRNVVDAAGPACAKMPAKRRGLGQHVVAGEIASGSAAGKEVESAEQGDLVAVGPDFLGIGNASPNVWSGRHMALMW